MGADGNLWLLVVLFYVAFFLLPFVRAKVRIDDSDEQFAMSNDQKRERERERERAPHTQTQTHTDTHSLSLSLCLSQNFKTEKTHTPPCPTAACAAFAFDSQHVFPEPQPGAYSRVVTNTWSLHGTPTYDGETPTSCAVWLPSHEPSSRCNTRSKLTALTVLR